MTSTRTISDFYGDYELLDFGDGQKLERLGSYFVQRPCPSAERHRPSRDETRWNHEHASYRVTAGQKGIWKIPASLPESWIVQVVEQAMRIRLTPSGQIGIFPEQFENWQWLARCIRAAGRPLSALNLFGYTGGSTVAMARAGAEVTHVDAAKNILDWGRENARLNAVPNTHIHWIHDDAATFVTREVRRGKKYDGLIMDPPSYGHGPRKQPWKITRDLPFLLSSCRELLNAQPAFVLITCHSTGYRPPDLQAALDSLIFGRCSAGTMADNLYIQSSSGGRLHSGIMARWPTIPKRSDA